MSDRDLEIVMVFITLGSAAGILVVMIGVLNGWWS